MAVVNDIRSCPGWGTATERWRRNGAFSRTKVLEDVISASAEVNKNISTVNDDRRLMWVGYFVYRLLVSKELTRSDTITGIYSTRAAYTSLP